MTDEGFQELKAKALKHFGETEDEDLRDLLEQLLQVHDRQHVQLAGLRAGLALMLREIS